MTTTLHLLCAGAAQGLVRTLQPRLLRATGATVGGRFGAVGAMKQALLAGEPCDLMVVTDTMVGELVAAGLLVGASRAPLGRVRTGIAVPAGAPLPEVTTAEALKAALLAATGLYFPDPERATAGIHFANVMRRLGILDTLAPRLHTFPNGATAMRALADSGDAGALGCTQVTEIRYTDGVTLVAPLPGEFELATVYTAAVSARAADPARAALFVAMLAGPDARGQREAGGFEA